MNAMTNDEQSTSHGRPRARPARGHRGPTRHKTPRSPAAPTAAATKNLIDHANSSHPRLWHLGISVEQGGGGGQGVEMIRFAAAAQDGGSDDLLSAIIMGATGVSCHQQAL